MIPVNIPLVNRLSYDSIPRNKDLKRTISNNCNFPQRVLVIDWQGNCFICACEAWLPVSVGNILEFNQLINVWHNPISQHLQQDVNNKQFSHCAVDRCGILDQDKIMPGYEISINIDESCNLQCPSCRSSLTMLSSGPEFEGKLAMTRHIVTLLENFEHPCNIVMSGNGDPLASHIMRPLIQNYQPRFNHSIRLFTNGLLLRKQLPSSQLKDNITQYFISVDAGSSDVYKQVRLGGDFAVLKENLDYLHTITHNTNVEVLLKFVLQKDNWQDMQNFVDLCNHYGFNGVINRLENWSTWPNFADKDVIGNTSHQEHQQAVAELVKIYNQRHTNIRFNSSLEHLAIA